MRPTELLFVQEVVADTLKDNNCLNIKVVEKKPSRLKNLEMGWTVAWTLQRKDEKFGIPDTKLDNKLHGTCSLMIVRVNNKLYAFDFGGSKRVKFASPRTTEVIVPVTQYYFDSQWSHWKIK